MVSCVVEHSNTYGQFGTKENRNWTKERIEPRHIIDKVI